jgi:pimeloyl-ACP methyl ester carboxylesterase
MAIRGGLEKTGRPAFSQADLPGKSENDAQPDVGHSTGGGEVVRYLARHGESRVAKAVLIGSVPPLMVHTDANPGGLRKSVFDGFQDQVAQQRSVFYRDLAAAPFYGFNRPGAEPVQAIIENWWRQGMIGGARRTTTASSRSPRPTSPGT